MCTKNAHPQIATLTLKCIVIDDEQAAINKLEAFIRATTGLQFVGAEKDPLKAQLLLSSTENLPDIVFLDIEMKGSTGLALAKLLMGKSLVVFTTGHSQFAADAYRLNAVDYLLKPISYSLFLEAVQKCRTHKQNTAPGDPLLIFLKDALTGQVKNIDQNEILYIQSIGNYCKIYFSNATQIMPHMSLKQLLTQLSKEHFVRIHKSYVINLKHIRNYNGNGVIEIKPETKLEVGRTFRRNLKQKIKQTHGR